MRGDFKPLDPLEPKREHGYNEVLVSPHSERSVEEIPSGSGLVCCRNAQPPAWGDLQKNAEVRKLDRKELPSHPQPGAVRLATIS